MSGRCLTALAAAVLLVAPVPALAHEEHALYELTVLDTITPELDGIEIRVVHLDSPALVVTNETDEVLTVLGEKGEPFLQIGPQGVRANSESPTTYRSSVPRREVVPRGLRPSARPRWILFSEESSWTWFDPRLRATPKSTSWNVSFRVGSDPVEVEGSFQTLQGHGHFETEMQSPEVDGLDLRLTQGAIPAVYVRNDTGKVLTVPGDAEEPFLQIGPDGVLANLRSPTYYTSGTTAIAKVPAMADASAPPKWKKVSPHPVWAWLERRAAVPSEVFQGVQLGTERRTVLEWTSDYTLGGEPLPVTGRVDWIPPQSSGVDLLPTDDDTPWLLIGLVGIAALAAAWALFFRRPGIKPS